VVLLLLLLLLLVLTFALAGIRWVTVA